MNFNVRLFSGSETSMIALNRVVGYVVWPCKGRVNAERVRPPFGTPRSVNWCYFNWKHLCEYFGIGACYGVITIHYFGKVGVIIAIILLTTLLILIFSEMTLKILAALHSQRVTFPAALPLQILLRIFLSVGMDHQYCCKCFLRLFGVIASAGGCEP